MRLGVIGVAVSLLIGLVSLGPAVGRWRHKHNNYPRKPYGAREIKDVFGRPCGRKADANGVRWWASDTELRYRVRFHRKLGGRRSSNLDHDVKGHIGHRHKRRFVRSGIGAYSCRLISGTNSYSTHSWGIAVDISWNYEHYGHNGHPCHVVKRRSKVPRIWKNHRWKWGRGFPRRDCMHFQYASGY